jgi:NNP family nitrate/nitrite transporter-like MFS transporter
MTTATEHLGTPSPLFSARSRWITDWRPEDEAFWDAAGKLVARRNLIFSILSEHIGFSVWSIWSVLVLFMGPKYGIDPAGKFLVVSVPTLIGSVLRVPYAFAVAKFGGRNWTVFSAALLLIPVLLAAAVLKPGVSYTTLFIIAAFAGIGGGNFASSMANINAFSPDRYKGWALGLNAGGGNLGVAAVQLVGLLVLAVASRDHPRLVLAIYVPLIVLAALGAALFMDNLAMARNGKRAIRAVMRHADSWIISFLYIGTFGSFIGFGFAFGQVLQVQFTADFSISIKAAYLTFLGPLLGSLIRPVGGKLADRFGGAEITFWNFVAMAASAGLVVAASQARSLPTFLTGLILLIVFSGLGNGSTYKMIPVIFRGKTLQMVSDGGDTAGADTWARRLSSAPIGLAGAIGAFGGVLVDLAFRQSFLSYQNGNAAYGAFLAFYAAGVAVTYVVYLRPRRRPTTAA